MADASKCGLPEFREGACCVYAARITGVEMLDVPGIPGCRRLTFGELGGKVANVLGYWAEQNAPQAGGWFVVPTTGGAAFMRHDDFVKRFGGASLRGHQND